MNTIFSFDFCAVLVFVIILFSMFLRRLTYGRTNRLFILLMTSMLISTVLSFIDNVANASNLSAGRVFASIVLNYLHFVFFYLSLLIFVFFVMSVGHHSFKKRLWFLYAGLVLPYAVMLALLLMNAFTHIIFYVTPESGYERGPSFFLILIIFGIYFIFGLFFLARCYRYLDRDKWIALSSVYAFGIIAFVIQYLFPHILIEMFSLSVASLVLLLVVMRAELLVDFDTGLQNYISYKTEIKKVLATNGRIQIMFIRYINSFEVRAVKGEDAYNDYIKKIASLLVDTDRLAGGNSSIFYDSSGCFFLVSDRIENPSFSFMEMIPKMRNQRMGDFKGAVSHGARLNPMFSMINVPEDAAKYSDIIKFGESFHKFIPLDRKFLPAAAIMHRNDYQLLNDMDMIIDRAIKNNSFRMYYQPIYSVKDRCFKSAEALIRLKDPYFGEIPPQLFITEAERSGRISEIGDFVLDSVFKFAAEADFEALGLDFIEINLSVAQCIQHQISDKMQYYSSKHHVSPSRINFEITETAYNTAMSAMDMNVHKLCELGYSFSLDDFGTGYSNMQRILSLPLTLVKIDKSLIDEIEDSKEESIVRNTINMVKELSMKVVVEGVEMQSTYEKIAALGADYIQGFYFARPMPGTEFVEFVKRRRGILDLF